NLPALRQIGFQANRRLLETERITHDCIMAEDAFQRLNRPVQVDAQRASALRFADSKVQALWNALLVFRLLPTGFSNAQLRIHLTELLGKAPVPITPGAMTYQLRACVCTASSSAFRRLIAIRSPIWASEQACSSRRYIPEFCDPGSHSCSPTSWRPTP